MDKIYDDISEFLKLAPDFEGKIKGIGLQIREKSKIEYGSDLIYARLNLMAIAHYLLGCKSMVPGSVDEDISNKLLLISIFYQGTNYIEDLISEGQYIKACAAIKQDYELLARINAINTGNDKPGKVPNITNLPEEVRPLYGDLNKIAHISKSEILDTIVHHSIDGEALGISPFCKFIPDLAKSLYELHLFTLVNIVREHINLFKVMYDDWKECIDPIMKYFVTAVEFLKSGGFTEE